MYPIYWFIAVAAFLLLEILTLGLTSVWFAGGAALAAVAALLGAPLFVQLIIFIGISCLLFTLTRPIAKKYLNNKVQKTNADALVGQKAIVKEPIENIKGQGMIYINGLDWSARSADGENIPAGANVIIKEIQGVKLIVETEKEKEE